MLSNRFTHHLVLALGLSLTAPGCAILSNIFGDEDKDKAPKTEPEAEKIAELDASIEERLAWVAKRPIDEHFKSKGADGLLLDITQDINMLSHKFVDEAAKETFRQQRFERVHGVYAEFFAKAEAAAMAAGDPELAQAQTSTLLSLQERYEWAIERADVMAAFEAEAEAIAALRQQVFAERGEYTKLNEKLCVASSAPMSGFDQPQPELSWHFARDSEVHVRCIFPTTIRSQVSGGMSYEIVGSATAWGRTTKDPEASGRPSYHRLESENVRVSVEVQRYMDERYFDFAFDLGELTKELEWGYVRINGTIEWSVVDSNSRVEERSDFAPMRLSFR